MKSDQASRWIGPLGGWGVPVLSFVGLHVLHPPGAPEKMTADEVTTWASSGSAGLWAGGVLLLVSALALAAWASAVAPGDGLADRWTRSSLGITATLLAAAGLLQVSVGIISTPEERLADGEVLAVLVFLYGQIAISAWCFVGPALLCSSVRRDGSRAVRVLLTVLGVATTLSLVLPPVSWLPAYAGMVVLGFTRAGVTHPPRSGVRPAEGVRTG